MHERMSNVNVATHEADPAVVQQLMAKISELQAHIHQLAEEKAQSENLLREEMMHLVENVVATRVEVIPESTLKRIEGQIEDLFAVGGDLTRNFNKMSSKMAAWDEEYWWREPENANGDQPNPPQRATTPPSQVINQPQFSAHEKLGEGGTGSLEVAPPTRQEVVNYFQNVRKEKNLVPTPQPVGTQVREVPQLSHKLPEVEGSTHGAQGRVQFGRTDFQEIPPPRLHLGG